jgi:hypothetical protein
MAAHEFRQGTEIIYSDIAFYKKVGKAFADCIIYAFCGDSTLVDFLSQDIPSGFITHSLASERTHVDANVIVATHADE